MASLATKYTYTITRVERGLNIDLVRTADGATKRFFLAGGSEFYMTKHMASLTDACCEGFFPEVRRKAEKPAKG